MKSTTIAIGIIAITCISFGCSKSKGNAPSITTAAAAATASAKSDTKPSEEATGPSCKAFLKTSFESDDVLAKKSLEESGYMITDDEKAADFIVTVDTAARSAACIGILPSFGEQLAEVEVQRTEVKSNQTDAFRGSGDDQTVCGSRDTSGAVHDATADAFRFFPACK